ncbi:Alpha/Beta hydrolase protein [Flagelloscypha sp. PMI_526]|nr:Alpha/Beta hydrolase protein [Flagelloscypha sp. PMI_526]
MSMAAVSHTALLICQTRQLASLVPSSNFILKNTTRSFSVEYRLASTRPFDVVHPFSTTLIDCLNGYHYLARDAGYGEENIIVVGDSAGGNLSIALTRYLWVLDSPQLKQPGALLLLSPWVDLGNSHATPGSSILTNSASDYVIYEPSPSWSQTAYLQPHGYGIADFNECISPASLLFGVRSKVIGSYQGWPKTHLAAGGAELLFDEIRTLREDMENDIGKDLLYIEKEDASHDWLLWEWYEPERSETLADIEMWLVTL